MKPTSALAALIVIPCGFVIFPLIATSLNNTFHLPQFTSPLLQAIGLLLLLSGLALIFTVTYLFFTVGKGTPVPIEPPKKFVVSGIYKYSRNPMFVGNTLVLLGLSLIFGHLLLYLYTLLAFLIFHIGVVIYEEPGLRKRFGESYINYCKKVPRWL
jgi:protein-S-isoprenylcysteine O-methyltransferase Ste14